MNKYFYLVLGLFYSFGIAVHIEAQKPNVISTVVLIPTKGFISINKAYHTLKQKQPTKNMLAPFISQNPNLQHVTLVGFDVYTVPNLSPAAKAQLIKRVRNTLHIVATKEIQRTLKALKISHKGKNTPVDLHFNNFEFFVLRFVGTFKPTPVLTTLIKNIEKSFKATLKGDKKIKKIVNQQATVKPHISLGTIKKGMKNNFVGRRVKTPSKVADFHISKPYNVVTAF